MIKSNTNLETEFDAALSMEELENGELLHRNIETLRKIAMAAGLTKNSDELQNICNDSPKEIQDALTYGVQSYEHYQNLMLLLESSISRIYSASSENPKCSTQLEGSEVQRKVMNILSASSQGTLS